MKPIHLAPLLALVLGVASAARAGVTTLDLGGRWTLRQQGGGEAIPAAVPGVVPGVVHTDLLAAGKIPDPFYGKNEDDLQWIGEATWTYSRDFDVPADWLKRGQVLLRFRGLDTVAAIDLNGQRVAETDNMFRAYEFDVKALLKEGTNAIRVTFSPIQPYIKERIERAKKELSGPATWYDGMPMIRKPVYSEGWDFGPRFYTSGIWKPVELVAWDAARLTYVTVDQAIRGDLAADDAAGVDLSVTAHADVDPAANGLTATATVSLDGKPVAETSAAMSGESTPLALSLERPALWWPAGMGGQPLYDVTVEVKDRDGNVIDRNVRRIGVRRVELLPKSDDRPLRLRVNGREIFAKGANWIPSDMFAPRETRAHVRDLLSRAVDANFNSMRVWGGGYYPGEDFFDAADEMGLLIWMDFAYACKPYPIGNPTWAADVRQETAGVVRRLRDHPSMAVWCGNNEVDAVVKSFGVMGRDEYDQLFHGLIGATVEREYPAAQYVGGSPEAGDEHNWWVWHVGADFEKYRQSHGWMTEFGFQSFPVPATVETYTAPADRDSVLGDVMTFHQNNKDGNKKILELMSRYFRPAKDFNSTLWLSQINQAMGMTLGIEHWRGDWPNSSGSYVWQYDDCWPGPTWACVDYFGRPKAVLYRLRHAYAPLMVTGVFDEKERSLPLKVVSEFAAAGNVTLAWKLTDLSGKTITQGKADVAARAGTASTDGPTLDLSAGLERAGGPASALLRVEATADDGTTATATILLARPKAMDLRDPGLSLDVKKAGDGYDVTVTAQRPALWVWLDVDGDPDATFGDNFVHLDPASPVTIRVTPSKPTDADALKKTLVARSLYDTYDHADAASAAAK